MSSAHDRPFTAAEDAVFGALAAGDHARANELCKEILRVDPGSPITLALRSMALGSLLMGKPSGAEWERLQTESAELAARVVAHIDPRRARVETPVGQIQLAAYREAQTLLARRQYQAGHYEAALAHAEAGLQLEERAHVPLLQLKALCLLRLGRDRRKSSSVSS